MAPSVPPALKKIKVFLARADELDRDKNNPESRVVAYNCRQYAVLSGIPLATDGPSKQCLGELLSGLEGEKEAMRVFSREEHWKICRKVADRVFDKADGEDRGGVANKGTAKTFYAAGTFYEILQQFYEKEGEGEGEAEDEGKEQREEEEQRRIYCKWKATEILNAIKEGRTPTPGGYQQDELEEMAFPLVGPPVDGNDGGGMPSIDEGLPSIREASEELPPAPPMPDEAAAEPEIDVGPDEIQPGGIEVNIDGDATPMVEDVNEDEGEESGDEDLFIPGATKQAAEDLAEGSNIFVDAIHAVEPPPPSYDSMAQTDMPSIPPPVTTKPLPPTPAPAPAPSHSSGMLSGLFGKSPSTTKLSKDKMADAVELTKFALAALQKGDGELGRQRLEQALGIWHSKSKKHQSRHATKLTRQEMADAAAHARGALAALQRGDQKAGRKQLEQALGGA